MSEKKRRAIVTGGSRGIGRAIVKELANKICSGVLLSDIVFVDDDAEKCAADLEKEINGSDVNIYAFQADATSFTDAQATVDAAVEKMGGVDILINNAGITKDNLLLRMSAEDFDRVINVNLKSVFNYTKAVLRPMMKQRYGRIVNIASVVGLIGNPGQANYVASKAGVIGFTKTMAKELGSRNITVNAIAPGFIETEMTKKLNDRQREGMLSGIPLQRMGQPEDIAKVVTFLCSPEADYITGQVIAVDGGMTM
ncbi:MAG: 3-oxoacyl-[acyl-carrier-protein] reductase [Chlorobi bacterium]|nr:3-oxoacyl-[acyl-carrier-protein] reductase [Chlorobiota bacterium]